MRPTPGRQVDSLERLYGGGVFEASNHDCLLFPLAPNAKGDRDAAKTGGQLPSLKRSTSKVHVAKRTGPAFSNVSSQFVATHFTRRSSRKRRPMRTPNSTPPTLKMPPTGQPIRACEAANMPGVMASMDSAIIARLARKDGPRGARRRVGGGAEACLSTGRKRPGPSQDPFMSLT